MKYIVIMLITTSLQVHTLYSMEKKYNPSTTGPDPITAICPTTLNNKPTLIAGHASGKLSMITLSPAGNIECSAILSNQLAGKITNLTSFSGDDQLFFISGGNDKALKLWAFDAHNHFICIGTTTRMKNITCVSTLERDDDTFVLCLYEDATIEILMIDDNGTFQVLETYNQINSNKAITSITKINQRVFSLNWLGATLNFFTIQTNPMGFNVLAEIKNAHKNIISASTFAAYNNHEYFVSTSYDKSINWWHMNADHKIQKKHSIKNAHYSNITSLSPIKINNIDLLASAAADGSIKLWGPKEGRDVTCLHEIAQAHEKPIIALSKCSLSNTHDLLISQSIDHEIKSWRLIITPEKVIYPICLFTLYGTTQHT